MATQISKIDVWAGEVDDRPGGLAMRLKTLSDAGADLEFVIARRAPEKPGTGVVFLAPLRGAAQTRAAQSAALSKAAGLHALRVEGVDKPGIGVAIAGTIAQEGINMRGLSAAAIGRRYVCYLAFDTDADAKKAQRALKRLFGGK